MVDDNDEAKSNRTTSSDDIVITEDDGTIVSKNNKTVTSNLESINLESINSENLRSEVTNTEGEKKLSESSELGSRTLEGGNLQTDVDDPERSTPKTKGSSSNVSEDDEKTNEILNNQKQAQSSLSSSNLNTSRSDEEKISKLKKNKGEYRSSWKEESRPKQRSKHYSE